MDYGRQLAVKQGQVEEIFGRELKLVPDGLTITPSPEVWGYRNRINLRVLWENGTARFVYHEPGEQTSFVPVDRCFLVPDRTNDLMAELLATINREEWEAVAEFEIRESRFHGKSLVIFHLQSASRLEEMAGKLAGLHERFPLSGIVAIIEGEKNVREEILGGVPRLEESIGGVVYKIGARSFFQVNVAILEKVFADMRQAVHGIAKRNADPVIADLYCGLGTFGLMLAPGAREVFGVEPEPENIRYLKKNIGRNRAGNFSVCEGTSEEWLPELLKRDLGVVILDPPRRGAEARMLGLLAARPVPLVLYLSCNPATLARDLKILLKAYELRDLKIYDFFPHTPHIESLAVLSRR
jgi:23S rRNA (uracil1939-C5)-methyltransferase